MPDTIGTAYVQIEPSFDGVVPKIDKEFGGVGKESGNTFMSGFGSVMGTAGKVIAGAAAAGATAVGGMVSKAVSAYGEYEQLIGGVETLFKDASGTVEANADRAFMTAGLSANEYMETVTSFSASLLQSLGGDTEKAASIADMAIIDMSDNANKMGSSMESIQNAYQGFAKQNYTMLDNLKLGYGGTKEEMKRLLEDASKLAGQKFDISSYSDVIEAIHVIQTEMGLTGTTSEEAAATITGSLSSVKAQWENMMVAIANGEDWDIGVYIDNLVQTVQTFAGNVMPIAQQALVGISSLIEGLGPEIAAAIPDLISEILPGLLSAGVDIIKALGEGILKAIPDLMPTITEVILQLCDMLISMLPELIQIGFQVILQLAMGIAEALPELIPSIVQTVLAICEYLIDNIDLLIDAAIQLIMGLAEGLISALPILIEKAPEIVIKLALAIIRNAPKILEAAIELILMLCKGMADNFKAVVKAGKDIVDKVKEGFSDKVQQAKEWGKDMIQNFIDGVMSKFNALKDSVKKCAQAVKDFLGFSEPAEGPLSNFHTYAPDMMDLFAQGIQENIGTVEQALNAATADVMSAGLDVETAQNVQMSVNAATNDNDGSIGQIEALLHEVIDKLQMPIVMDTGALVGATAGAYNVALGEIAVRGGRR